MKAPCRPAGMSPNADLLFLVATNGGNSKIWIKTNGQVVAFSAVDGT